MGKGSRFRGTMGSIGRHRALMRRTPRLGARMGRNGHPRVLDRTALRPGLLMLVLTVQAILGGCAPAEESVAGSRFFGSPIFLEDSAATSANVSIGDIDRDGHLDLVLVKGRHWPLDDYVLLGDGSGGIRERYVVSSHPDRSYSGVLVDMDGDGDLDMVVSNDQPDEKVVHLNDGTGRFKLGSTFGEPEWSTRHVSVADLNGDEVPDAVLANRYGRGRGLSYICFGDGVGGFTSPCDGFSEGSATTITPADFNGDGAPDLVVPYRDGGQSFIYLNDGTGRFDERVPFGPPTAVIRSVRAADLDGDGLVDLAIIDEREGPAVLRGSPGLRFGPAEPLGDAGAAPYAMELADLDGNGRPDIIVGYVEARPVVYFNDGDEVFTPVPFGDSEGVAYGFAVADLNEDGLLDIAMARSDARNVLYFGARADSPVNR